MMDQTLKLLGLGLCVAVAAGCPAEDDPAADGTESGTPTTGATDATTTNEPATSDPTTTDTDPTEGGLCPGVPESGFGADESCTANSECESGLCLLFQDVPVDPDAVCGEMLEDCSTRVTGTVFDFLSRTALSGEGVRIVRALDALSDPGGAEAVASGTADDDGRVDFQSEGPISSPIAIIAMVGGEGTDYFLTATGVAGDDGGYAPGTGIHEFFAVPNRPLDDWNTALAELVADAEQLPVGPAGGVVGFVRDAEGNPVAGATVAPDMDGSSANIYYPQADDSVVETMTDETGLFIVVGGSPGGEDFVATSGAMSGGGRAGTAPNVVFSLVITVQ